LSDALRVLRKACNLKGHVLLYNIYRLSSAAVGTGCCNYNLARDPNTLPDRVLSKNRPSQRRSCVADGTNVCLRTFRRELSRTPHSLRDLRGLRAMNSSHFTVSAKWLLRCRNSLRRYHARESFLLTIALSNFLASLRLESIDSANLKRTLASNSSRERSCPLMPGISSTSDPPIQVGFDLALLQSARVFSLDPGFRQASTLGSVLVRLRRTKISRCAKSIARGSES
jgi:hypothetical protein